MLMGRKTLTTSPMTGTTDYSAGRPLADLDGVEFTVRGDRIRCDSCNLPIARPCDASGRAFVYLTANDAREWFVRHVNCATCGPVGDEPAVAAPDELHLLTGFRRGRLDWLFDDPAVVAEITHRGPERDP